MCERILFVQFLVYLTSSSSALEELSPSGRRWPDQLYERTASLIDFVNLMQDQHDAYHRRHDYGNTRNQWSADLERRNADKTSSLEQSRIHYISKPQALESYRRYLKKRSHVNSNTDFRTAYDYGFDNSRQSDAENMDEAWKRLTGENERFNSDEQETYDKQAKRTKKTENDINSDSNQNYISDVEKIYRSDDENISDRNEKENVSDQEVKVKEDDFIPMQRMQVYTTRRDNGNENIKKYKTRNNHNKKLKTLHRNKSKNENRVEKETNVAQNNNDNGDRNENIRNKRKRHRYSKKDDTSFKNLSNNKEVDENNEKRLKSRSGISKSKQNAYSSQRRYKTHNNRDERERSSNEGNIKTDSRNIVNGGKNYNKQKGWTQDEISYNKNINWNSNDEDKSDTKNNEWSDTKKKTKQKYNKYSNEKINNKSNNNNKRPKPPARMNKIYKTTRLSDERDNKYNDKPKFEYKEKKQKIYRDATKEIYENIKGKSKNRYVKPNLGGNVGYNYEVKDNLRTELKPYKQKIQYYDDYDRNSHRNKNINKAYARTPVPMVKKKILYDHY